MIRWLIATYIIVVLVLSAKAGAKVEEKSNLVFNKFNYSPKASFLKVQEPLPEFKKRGLNE